MAKRSNRSKEEGSAPDASEWLEHRMDDGLLDLDVLAAMPMADVKSSLKSYGADDKAFTEGIKQRLAGLDAPAPASRRTRSRSADRSAAPRQIAAQPDRRWARWFTLRNALIVSAIVIIAVALGPLVAQKLQSMRELPPVFVPEEPATPPDTTLDPTTFEGPAPSEPVRGVHYIVAGLGRVALSTPLPANPGSLEASYELRMRVDPSGNVIGLESLTETVDPFEVAVMDSLLRWRFEPGRDRGKTNAGTVKVIYKPVER